MKKIEILDSLKLMIQTAFPGSEVTYWRDRPPVKSNAPVAVVFRDTGGTFTKVNAMHEHRVRVEIEVLVFSSDVGTAMNEQLDKLIKAIGSNPTLGQQRTICELAAFAFDTAGDGFESGVAQLAMDIVYRTEAWAGL